MRPDERVYVAGGETLIGAALLCELRRQGYENVVGRPGEGPDLTDPRAVRAFFAAERPRYVFVAAGLSGGIAANQRYPADLMVDNLLVGTNLLATAREFRPEKLLYLASSCSYPKHCRQPMRAEDLLTGPLEPTNEAYALAKLAGLKLAEAYRRQYGAPFVAGIPANAFGPGDDFRPEESHVCAALLRRLLEAREAGADAVVIWGTGAPRREFIYADDLADACLFVMRHYEGEAPINLGVGCDVSIRELAELARDVVGYRGRLEFDPTRPDGMPVKLLDSGPLHGLGWRPRTGLREGLVRTLEWYVRARTGNQGAPV